jgi:hypothetical protein
MRIGWFSPLVGTVVDPDGEEHRARNLNRV